MKMYGLRRLHCTTWNDETLDLTFVVSDVNRPIVAVGDLLDQGYVPDFRQPAGLIRSGRRLPLIMAGQLYYLPVHVESVTCNQPSNVDACATLSTSTRWSTIRLRSTSIAALTTR